MARAARVYKAPSCAFNIEGDHIVTDKKVRHKVSGTAMAGILGISPFNTPFQVACQLLGVCRENLDGKPAVETGKILEPVIIDYLGKAYPDKGTFLPAEDIYEKRAGDHDAWESDFRDNVFAGHVDGIVTSPEGVDRILEIKTTSNLDSWAMGVPDYYYWQVGLYNEFITQQDTAVVGLGIVDDLTYRNPLTWVPNERSVTLFEMPIDREQVREGMGRVQDWYNEFIVNGVTPDFDPANPRDLEMFMHLKNLSKDVEQIQQDVDKLGELQYEIQLYEAGIQQKSDEAKEIKDRIKDYMVAHHLSTLNGMDMPYTVSLTTSKRESIDKNLLMQDGIDPEKYTKYTESNILKIKERRD